jgi:hypothetical protein
MCGKIAGSLSPVEQLAPAILKFFRVCCEKIFTTEAQRGSAATKMRKVGFTTKARRTRRFS